MGAWGYNYTDNDYYFDMVGEWVDPLISALATELDKDSIYIDNFRAQLLWTVNLLKNTEEIQLSEWHLEVFKVSIEILRDSVEENSKQWSKPKKYLKTVEAELSSIEEWLDSFEQLGLLEDRMPSQFEAFSKNL